MENILILTLGVIAGVIYEDYGKQFFRRIMPTSSSKFWKDWLSENALIVCATDGDRKTNLTRGTGAYDCMALKELSIYFTKISPGCKTPSIMEQDTEDWTKKNIIAIGGPVNNHVSEQVLKNLGGLAYTFNDKTNTIENSNNKKIVVRESQSPSESSFDKDSGLICHLPNPQNHKKHVIIIAGCWGQGTLGGMELLINNIDKIRKKAKDHDFFQVVYDIQLNKEKRPNGGKIDWESWKQVWPVPIQEENGGFVSNDLIDQFKNKVSVVIPCRNEQANIAKIVKMFKNHFAVGEIIVVDNGSDDDTVNIATAAGANKIISEIRQGKGYAMVAGIKESAFPFIFFIDGDIENPKKEWLNMLLSRLISKESLAVVRANPQYYPPLVTICVRPLLNILLKDYPDIQKIEQPLGGIVLIKKEIAEKIILQLPTDWGVDVGLTIQIVKNNIGYDEVKIGRLIHGERLDISRRDEMSRQIIQTILDKSK